MTDRGKPPGSKAGIRSFACAEASQSGDSSSVAAYVENWSKRVHLAHDSQGISMVLKEFPLLLATAHSAGAALLLLATLALVRRLRLGQLFRVAGHDK